MDFVDSRSEVLVQAADVMGGSIARHFDEKLKSPNSKEFLNILADNIYAIDIFPPIYTPYIATDGREHGSPFDSAIAKGAIFRANQFLSDYEREATSQRRGQILCVRLLLAHHFFHPNTFLSRNRLLDGLNQGREEKMSQHALKTNVIAGLRDAEVLIASRMKGGYKIASSLHDILEFLNLASYQIVPLLKRVELARKLVWRATGKKLDILERDEYSILRKSMEELNISD